MRTWSGFVYVAFIIGGVIAYLVSESIDVDFLVPFAAGNFVYIAASDLLPEIRTETLPSRQLLLSAMFGLGLGALLLVALIS